MLLAYIGPATGFDPGPGARLMVWVLVLGLALPLPLMFAWRVWGEHVRKNG